MHTIPTLHNQQAAPEEPASEYTRIQARLTPHAVAVEALDYHLFSPQRTHHPLLEQAYEVWRDGWQATLEELDAARRLFSDEFARQDEIGVISSGHQCLSVTGIRWLDLSLSRSLEDSYFQHWPKPALAALGPVSVCITSNTIVHPGWRRIAVEARDGEEVQSTRLAFATIALSVRRFLASGADSIIALTRNDRAMGRAAAELGATKLAQITLHGVETDVIVVPRAHAKPHAPAVDDLWRRRYQT